MIFRTFARSFWTAVLAALLAFQPCLSGMTDSARAGLLSRAVAMGTVYISMSLIRRVLLHASSVAREAARRKLYEIVAKSPDLAPVALRMIEGVLKSPRMQRKLEGPNGPRLLQEEVLPMVAKLKAWNRPAVADAKLGNIVRDLFRDNARIGNGTTADAVRHELETGLRVGGKTHSEKARLAIDSLTRRLLDPGVSQADKSVAKTLVQDLTNALRGR
ncbi:hypothetical protein AX289_25185 [Methylorubrum populi]|nr:hypothetical protein AX289_25185 [Methylorubrum populi]